MNVRILILDEASTYGEFTDVDKAIEALKRIKAIGEAKAIPWRKLFNEEAPHETDDDEKTNR